MPITEPDLLLISLLIVMTGALVQGSLGMGFGQIGAAGLIWTVPELLPGTVIIMAILVGSIGAWRERQGVDYFKLSYALLGRTGGAIVALPLLFWTSGHPQDFALLFAVLILIGAGCSLCQINLPMNRFSLLGGGLASGVMGTITSVGAPPMGLVFQNETATTARPTLNLFFALGAIPSLAVLAWSGHLQSGHIWAAIILLPGYLLGVYLSRYLHVQINEQFRLAVIGFSTVSALALILRATL